MCERCEKVKMIDSFPSPKAYLDCLKYIQSLVDSGSFEFESKNCDTDKVKDEVFKELEKSYYDNLVILGGEPTAEYNIETVTELAKEFKEKFPNKKLIVFSGHVIEDIYDYKLLKYTDILIDGQFIEELYSPLLFFKGSSNQRTIDVQETLKTGKVVLYHE